MRKKLIFLILMTGFQISAATSDVAGEYELITGKVGIYRMHTMIITKNSSNKLYTVRFLGDERNLTYDDAQLRGKTLRISDRGMPIIIKIENDRAILDSDSARFRRRQLISSKFNMTKKSYKQGLTNYLDFSEGSRVGITVEGIVVNQYLARSNLPRRVVAELVAEGLPVLENYLSPSIKVKESHEACMPLVHMLPKHKVTLEYQALYDALSD